MAEVEAVIISEVEKLESLLVDKANYIGHYTKMDVEKIIDEVKMIVQKLKAMKSEEKKKLKFLISDVVEDVGNAHRIIGVGNDHIGARLRSICRDLRTINEGFHQLSENGVGEGDGEVVGLEEDVDFLLHNMKSITSIVGFDGFGKTTLAREVYNHANVVEKFNLRGWVNCMENLGRKELLINLIQQVADSEVKDVEKMEVEGLQNMLRQQLQGKRYLIVLDNIWRYSCLDFVKQSLPPQDRESKLLVTYTEDKSFAFSFLVDYTYNIRPLDEDTSWPLLLKTMFPPGGNNSSAHKFAKQFERKGKLMLMRHTSGMPLAIKDVGMEWAEKRRLGREWEEVVESEDLELRASLGALESSFYHYLSPNEKSCFLHASLFKQGTSIKLQKFEQTYFASRGEQLSGPITPTLILRKIRIDKDGAKPGRMKYCRVGSVFHKLSIKKGNEGNHEAASHRVIYCNRERVNCATDQDEGLISLFFHGGGRLDASPSYWKRFEQLRVLDFEGFGLKLVPETVGELIELRYLGLRNNCIQQLPSSLGCLKNLMVLDIALNFMVEVPDVIWQLKALVHLYMSDISCRKPLQIKATLKNLQTITYIPAGFFTHKDAVLWPLKFNAVKLGIEELNENSNVYGLEEMFNLEYLVLRGSRFRSMPSLGNLNYIKELKLEGLITMLPKALNFPYWLSYLSLVNSCFDEDPMPVLKELPNLESLKLQNAYTGRQMVLSNRGFPQLEHLFIKELWHLRNIKVEPGALQNIKRLEVTSCPCLQSMPHERFTRNIMKFKMGPTNNIAAKIKKLGLFSTRPHVVVDYKP